jgi:hypothetical protein
MSRPFVCTLATNHALQDLHCFLKSLMLWSSSPPTVYLFADKDVAAAIPDLKYTGKIVVKETLAAYSHKMRTEMERISVDGKTLWYQFQMEKLNLLDWVFSSEKTATDVGVFYLDADIFFLGELPAIPGGCDVALSPHMIRMRDEALYGKYNAGYFWTRSPNAVQTWRSACATSRFFEQAALETFDSEEWDGRVYKFPVQTNYGWWRMFQADTDCEERKGRWGIRREAKSPGITVDGQPLISIHTHWNTSDFTTKLFNTFVRDFLGKIAPRHEPAKRLLTLISKSTK